MENSTVRTMRYVVRNCAIGHQIYAYSIAKAIGVEPQRIVRLFRRWAQEKNGFLVDLGKEPLPEGLRGGPPPRMYEVTEAGIEAFRASLKQLSSK